MSEGWVQSFERRVGNMETEGGMVWEARVIQGFYATFNLHVQSVPSYYPSTPDQVS
jgi:hypothetical protein